MKWFGEIGFKVEIEEDEPGVLAPMKIEKRQFYGDILKNSWKEQQADKINADLHISNRLSVVADPFLLNNFQSIAYVTIFGAKWTVGEVEVDPDRPRLNLTLGSLYLEEEDED